MEFLMDVINDLMSKYEDVCVLFLNNFLDFVFLLFMVIIFC